MCVCVVCVCMGVECMCVCVCAVVCMWGSMCMWCGEVRCRRWLLMKVSCSLVSGSYYGTTWLWTWKDPEWSPTFHLTSWVSLGSFHYPSVCSFLSCGVGKNLYSSTVPWDLFHTCTDQYSSHQPHVATEHWNMAGD